MEHVFTCCNNDNTRSNQLTGLGPHQQRSTKYKIVLWTGSYRPLIHSSSCSKKIGVLKNVARFTGTHLCRSHFLNKVAGLKSATLLKMGLQHRYFPLNFAKFKGNLFKEHLFKKHLFKEHFRKTTFRFKLQSAMFKITSRERIQHTIAKTVLKSSLSDTTFVNTDNNWKINIKCNINTETRNSNTINTKKKTLNVIKMS